MAYDSREAIQRWQQVPANKDEIRNGEVQVWLPPWEGDGPENIVVVTQRESQTVNVVSMRCVKRFPVEWWDRYRIQKPKHGDVIKLVLAHESSPETFEFNFEVREAEELDIILSEDAIERINASWFSGKGRTWVIRGTKNKTAEDTASANTAATEAAAKAAKRQNEKLNEQRRRQAHRQQSSSASTGSAGSAGSVDSMGSSPSTN